MRADAPNLRGIDPSRTCNTCFHSLWLYGEGCEVRCGKYDFVILDTCCLVCDDWKKEDE